MKIKGIGPVKAIQIKASFELNKRHYRARKIRNIERIEQAKDVYKIFVDELRDKKQEHFYVLTLDSNNQIISKDLVSIGTLNVSVVHPREIFRNAIKDSANSIIIIHNHPSGNLEPSPEDIQVTAILKNAGKLLGISVLDHLIIAGDGFRSIIEE
jgi:DNA repair protein RadC